MWSCVDPSHPRPRPFLYLGQLPLWWISLVSTADQPGNENKGLLRKESLDIHVCSLLNIFYFLWWSDPFPIGLTLIIFLPQLFQPCWKHCHPSTLTQGPHPNGRTMFCASYRRRQDTEQTKKITGSQKGKEFAIESGAYLFFRSRWPFVNIARIRNQDLMHLFLNMDIHA